MASATNQLLQSAFSRVFLIENGASPVNPPTYEGLMRATKPTWDQGKQTSVFVPNPSQYGAFDIAGRVVGEPGLPEIDVEAMYTTDVSHLLKLVARGCDSDLHIHFGLCKNPQDFDGGWDKSLILEQARGSNWTTNDIGAMNPGQNGQVTETTKFSGQRLYELKPLSFVERAQAQVNDWIVDMVFCDSPSCGSCGIASDGCQSIFAVSKSSGASPGLLSSIVYSTDGGKTWFNDPIDTLGASFTPKALVCVGSNIVVISADEGSINWAVTSDVVLGTETWVKTTVGFVASKGPNAIFSLSSTNTIIAGLGGYIYQTTDPTAGATAVLDPGIATTSDLLAIAAADSENIVIVGKANAIVVSSDGGTVWSSLLGPAPGVDLNAVWMESTTEWWIGGSDGNLYYTLNGGVSWGRKAFPGSGSGTIADIKFVTNNVGYLSHTTTTPKGRILRTTNGGFTWYVLPDSKGIMPNNHGFSALAVCTDPNIVFAGGLAVNNVDGLIVQGS